MLIYVYVCYLISILFVLLKVLFFLVRLFFFNILIFVLKLIENLNIDVWDYMCILIVLKCMKNIK